MEAYVIVFLVKLIFLVDGTTDEILVQFGGMHHWYETQDECEASLKEYGSDHIINEFLSQTNENEDEFEVELEKVDNAFCTKFNVESHNYPDFPEYDNMINEEKILGPKDQGLEVSL